MTFTRPPATWKPRAVTGGKYPPLSANAQGYTQEQVEAAMRSGPAAWDPRFELYDLRRKRILPDIEGVLDASVDYDDTREIKGSLTMSMLPDDRLRRGSFFRYLVKPIARLRMPDGGWVEFPMGLYPWTKPRRSIFGTTGTSEEWTITLGDQTHFLELAGPGDDPFIVHGGTPVVLYLYLLLYYVGFRELVEFSGITRSNGLVPYDSWYTYVTTARKKGKADENGNVSFENAQAETWLNIANDLHEMLGFTNPCFDTRTGVYQARPDRAWWADGPDVVYDTLDDSVTLLPVDEEPDLTKIANRVKGNTAPFEGQSGDPFGTVNVMQFQAIVDLDQYLPWHELAPARIQRYIDRPLKDPKPVSYEHLRAACVTELFNAIRFLDKVTLKRVGFLAQHDGSGIVGVNVLNDPALGGPPATATSTAAPRQRVQLFREIGRKLDLFTGDAESTLTSLARDVDTPRPPLLPA